MTANPRRPAARWGRTIPQLISLLAAGAPLVAQTHPLDPVSQTELTRGLAILQAEGALAEGTVVATLGLKEPTKAAVLAGQPIPRQLAAVTYLASANRTTQITIDLATDRIVGSRVMTGVAPHEARATYRVSRSRVCDGHAQPLTVRSKIR